MSATSIASHHRGLARPRPGPIAADGAMGSALIALGLPAGMAPEAWLLTPAGAAAVGAVHAGHAAAGARVVLTSTFGASRVRLADGPAAGRTADVCRAAVAIARAAVPPGVLVAGDLGPTGALLAPYGDLEPAAARDAFAEQAAALAAAGVDLLWVETMADLAEARAAVEGARSAAPGAAGRRHPHLRARPDPLRRPTGGRRRGARGAGSRRGRRQLRVGLRGRPRRPARARRRGARTAARREGERGPAGRRRRTGRVTYPATPADAADYARRAAELGALIVGGCCGTTAAHVAAIAAELARA